MLHSKRETAATVMPPLAEICTNISKYEQVSSETKQFCCSIEAETPTKSVQATTGRRTQLCHWPAVDE